MDEVHRPDVVRAGGFLTIFPELCLPGAWGACYAAEGLTHCNPACVLHVDLPTIAAQVNMDPPVAIPHACLANLLDASFEWACPVRRDL